MAVAIIGVLVFITNPIVCSGTPKLAPSANVQFLRSHVDEITVNTPPRHVERVDNLDKVATYIQRQLNSYGYDVKEQIYTLSGKNYRNVYVEVKSHRKSKNEHLVIGAHYDVCEDQPGADDNASGVAGLLELARLLAVNKPKIESPLILVFYTLEEPPTYDTEGMGSYVHAKFLHDRGIQVSAMISIEMIGYFCDTPGCQGFPMDWLGYIYPDTGNFVSIIGDTEGFMLVRSLKSLFSMSTDLPAYSLNAPRYIEGVDFSDHRSYWAFDYPAVMITDTSFYRNPNYHELTDTIDTLDFDRMGKVVQGLYGIATEY